MVLRSERLDPADSDTRELSPKESNLVQRPGGVYRGLCAGAAGFGDALEREPGAVARDVDEGRYTRAVAERLFGVVFADGAGVDLDATAERRQAILGERLSSASPGGPMTGRRRAAARRGHRHPRRRPGHGRLAGALQPVLRPASESLRGQLQEACARLVVPVQEAGPLGEDPAQFIDATIEFRLYLCPETGGVIETEVARAEDPRSTSWSSTPPASPR